MFTDADALEAVMTEARDRGDARLDLQLARPGGTTLPVGGQLTHVSGPLSEPTYFAAVFHQTHDAGR